MPSASYLATRVPRLSSGSVSSLGAPAKILVTLPCISSIESLKSLNKLDSVLVASFLSTASSSSTPRIDSTYLSSADFSCTGAIVNPADSSMLRACPASKLLTMSSMALFLEACATAIGTFAAAPNVPPAASAAAALIKRLKLSLVRTSPSSSPRNFSPPSCKPS